MKRIDLLCAEQDLEALQPILEQLRSKGVQAVQAQSFSKDRTVLAVLSENFYADENKTGALLNLISSGSENVLPLQLDGADIPERIMNSLYSRNIIMPDEGRGADLIAERIISALPKRKNRLPLILSIAGIALLAVVGFVIWRSLQGREAHSPEVSAGPAQILYDLPEGITPEDLEEIVDVIIVGEQLEYYTLKDIRTGPINNGPLPDWDYYAYRDYNESGAHWFSREDGHEYRMTRYADLRFLELMPNLRFLTMANIETGELPDLSGLKSLQNLMLMDCIVPDLEWVRGAKITKADILNTTGSIADFSPLTDCEKLSSLHIDLERTQQADLSRLSPPALDWLWINNANDLRNGLDLSSLSACEKLRECQFEYLPIKDISFLSGASRLEKLMLYEMDALTDISALRDMEKLRELIVDDCNRIRDYSPISSCKALESLMIETDRGRSPLRDASFLNGLPKLRNINLGGVELQNIDFLKSLSESRKALDRFGVWGTVRDWSGLAAIKTYQNLNIDPDNSPDFKRVMLPYLEDASIDRLALRRFADIDLSALPRVKSYLELDRCGIKDLSTIPENWNDWTAYSLNLNKCSSLRSLEGLQKQGRITQLTIYECPRLTDWSALEGMRLNDLMISWCYSLPDFSKFTATTIRIEGVEDVRDLEFLSGLETERAHNFELIGLDGLKNIQPLSRFHGYRLKVSPQLAEQAEDLVNAGNFDKYEIEYPEGGWEMDDFQITLESFDELDSLPPSLLRRISEVCLVGDTLVDISSGNIWEDWTEKGPVYMYQSWDSDEAVKLKYGEGSADVIEKLGRLTGLRRLYLFKQPVTSLDGIQNFTELEDLQVAQCDKLKDASAAFACQNLRNLRLDNCPVTSIQGVQNLWDLNGLNINGTKVSDLSPLSACDFSSAEENGGLWLLINSLPVKDYSPLTGLPLYRLDINNTEADLFVPALEGTTLKYIMAGDCFDGKKAADNNELFARLVRSHPELEYIEIGSNARLTDLSPLLELGELKEVRVSDDMKKAIASLDGKDLSFEFIIY